MRWIGADIYFAKDWLGHKNIQNTTIYSKFSTGTREARARRMFPKPRMFPKTKDKVKPA